MTFESILCPSLSLSFTTTILYFIYLMPSSHNKRKSHHLPPHGSFLLQQLCHCHCSKSPNPTYTCICDIKYICPCDRAIDALTICENVRTFRVSCCSGGGILILTCILRHHCRSTLPVFSWIKSRLSNRTLWSSFKGKGNLKLQFKTFACSFHKIWLDYHPEF